MNRIFLSILILLIGFAGLSQPKFNDAKLASEYFRNKEYDKAIVIYKSLYEDSPSGRAYYSMYLMCLTELQEFDLAEKVIKKEIKQNPKELSNYVELGYIYELLGESKKAEDRYQDALRKLTADQNQVIRLSNAFRSKRMYSYARMALTEGRKQLGNPTLFRNDLANIYLMEREYEAMINEYLDWLADNSGNLQNVKNRLQSAMYIDVDNDVYNMIKEGLIRRIQLNPNIDIYSDLLVWLYIQKKEFKKAFYQAKALDKRKQESGQRMMALGQMAASNGELETATEIYQYVVDKGSGSEMFFSAKTALLQVSYKFYMQQNKTSLAEMSELETMYQSALTEFGSVPNTAELMLNLAHIQAFYLNKTENARTILNNIIAMKGIKRDLIMLGKLELADIELFDGDIWEAALLFGQVEKDNEENPIGHEAKFRKARLAYYAGDFLWAQAQLDVLKASTSKLIANDAFALATLINDNTAMDTSETALMMFARADLLIYQNKNERALQVFDSIMQDFPNHTLADEIVYRKGEIMLKQKNYTEAVNYFKQVVDVYGNDILGDNALFHLASINDYNLNEQELAKTYYKKLITEYPGSIFVVEARKRYRYLRGDDETTEETIKRLDEVNP
ncbi:MAG: tetratricopeptide repeat protein [Bacteroidales bacterium]|nr:tetratricopeptide repeat protein [Bacteroidales bacterium]MCF8454886.1 tetratricopeptide repeat protein [Bacteroidales bacterium]